VQRGAKGGPILVMPIHGLIRANAVATKNEGRNNKRKCKVSQGKKIIMETQIFDHAKI